MKVVFQLGVYIHSLCIHLGNDSTLLQELVDPLEIYVLVDVILLCKVTAVADINDLLHRASPFRFRFTFIISQYPGNDNLYFFTAHFRSAGTRAQKRSGVQVGVWQ